MRKTDWLLALDIETVPDPELVPPDWPPEQFPKPPWHKVVALSFVAARIETRDGIETYRVASCRSGGSASGTEAELLRSFWEWLGGALPRVVTWNGRSFDMAVLRLRAMMHGICVSAWDRSGDKWSGYRHRYSPDWHCDLMDQISDYGASPRSSLQDVSIAWGFPGKIGGSGGSVKAMVERGEIDRVRAYCECDALLTYGAYLRWAGHTGLIDERSLTEGLADLATFLRASDAPHFAEFLAGWRDAPSAVPPSPAAAPSRPFPSPPPRPRLRLASAR